MAWNALENIPRQWVDATDNTVLNGYWLIAFEAGTSTRANIAIDSSGTGSAAKFQTNASGYLVTSGSVVMRPFVDRSVKLALVPTEAEADASDISNAVWPTVDNVDGMLTASSDALWDEFSGTPTQTSATTFTVTGDQTSTFVAGTRLKFTDSSTLYGVVFSSSYTSLTTVTVVLDSGSLSGSLSTVYTSIADVTTQPLTTHSMVMNLIETNAINVSLNTLFKNGVDVVHFGVVSSTSTSISTELNNALAYAKANRASLKIGPGPFVLGALVSLDVFAGISFLGSGSRVTRFYTTSAAAGFKFTNYRDSNIGGFSIYGSNYESEFAGQPLASETVSGVTEPTIALEFSATSGAAVNCTHNVVYDVFIIDTATGIKFGNSNNVQTSEFILNKVMSFRASVAAFDFEGTNTNNFCRISCSATTDGGASSVDHWARSGAGPIVDINCAYGSAAGTKATFYVQTTNSINLYAPFTENVDTPFILCESGITNDKGVTIHGGQLSVQQNVDLIDYQPTEGYISIMGTELNGQSGSATVTIGSAAKLYETGVTRDGVIVSKTITNTSGDSDSTTAVTTEETLKNLSMPANTLEIDNQAVKVVSWGSTAANANNKTIRIKLGSITLYDSSGDLAAPNATDWRIESYIIRTAATTQSAITSMFFDNQNVFTSQSTPTETLTSAVTIALTGQNGTASSGDISCRGLIVEPLLFKTDHI